MSEEKTQVQNARKDLDILNKMKNLPGGLVIIPLVIAVVFATFVPQVRKCMDDGILPDRMWIYDRHQTGRYAALQRYNYDRYQVLTWSYCWSRCW